LSGIQEKYTKKENKIQLKEEKVSQKGNWVFTSHEVCAMMGVS
jgi:hypothetical protein